MRLFASAALAATASAAGFQWGDVKPKHHLDYHDCYEGFQCARLILPMDWKNETNEATVEIAITKLPALVNDTDPAYGGPIFTNPGGPGGSGVSYVVGGGRALQNIVDIPGKKHYDIVSFDPRGIGRSTPSVDCYTGGILERAASYLEIHGNGALDSSLASLQYGMALTAAESQRCASSVGDFLSYVGTPNVARDMVAMVDKIEEERKARHSHGTGSNDDQPRLELRDIQDESAEDVPRLQYIGFSYGTVLGNYFASLFPGRVGRMILDGVCNTDDYANGAGWLTNTVDADEIADSFFTGCFKSGEDCGMYRRSDASGVDIKARFWSWIEELKETPMLASYEGSTSVLRSDDFLAVLTMAMYTPLATFQTLASDLGEAIAGNSTAIITRLAQMSGVPALTDACLIPNATDAAPLTIEARSSVLCVDGSDVTGHNSTWWKGYVDKQVAISKVVGAIWTSIRLPCGSWMYTTNWPFRGPFKTPAPSKNPSKPEKGKPAAPLFFFSNRLDPVTPLRAARKMAEGHLGAGVLVQEAMGHSVMGGGLVGPCTKKYVSEYFDTGAVPSEEVSCEAVCDPWDKKCVVTADATPLPAYKRTIHHLM